MSDKIGEMTTAPTSHPRVLLADRLALRPSEVAEALGVSERTIRQVLPELPHFRLGSAVVVPIEPLRDWLRARAKIEGNRVDTAVKEIMASIDESGNI